MSIWFCTHYLDCLRFEKIRFFGLNFYYLAFNALPQAVPFSFSSWAIFPLSIYFAFLLDELLDELRERGTAVVTLAKNCRIVSVFELF